MILATKPETQADRSQDRAISWEESSCPLCSSRHWTQLIEAQDPFVDHHGLWFAIVQCDSCGTCFTNPRPDASNLEHFFTEHECANDSRALRYARFWSAWIRGFAALPNVEVRSMAWHGQGRLLDFGCYHGEFLQRMHGRGWQVTGIEMSAHMVERARERSLVAYHGSLPQFDLEPESFDVITMWHSLCRVPDPLLVLHEARKLLTPGGKLVIAVPNIDSWPFRWFGRYWHGLNPPRHLTHFTPALLLQLLQRSRFRVEPIQYIVRSDWIRNSAQRASRELTSPPWQALLSHRLPARIAAWWAFLAEQSDCMLATAHR